MSTTTSTRVTEIDPKTGKRYVRTQTVEGATVTVTKYVGQVNGTKWSWSSALYDVIGPAGEVFTGAIKWNGKSFTVGSRPAASLSKAVRAVLGIEELPAPRPGKPATAKAEPKADAAPSTRKPRKSAAARAAEKAAADQPTGGGVIDKDPETGLPRIRSEVQAKADAIVAAQLARNAEAGQ